LIRKPEVLALQRAKANLQGEIGRILGEIGDARERISRTKEQIHGVRKVAIKAVVEQMHETHAELNDVRERIRSASGILSRIQITAPVRGIIVKLRYHTPGGVIEAGKNILEIVPLNEELLIEVRVRPQDIDNVRRGQRAVVRLTALSQRTTPMISGEVVYVSADALPNEKTTQQSPPADVYVARVKLDSAEMATILANFPPVPGMPAEVYIQTAERTFFEYLMQPIKDSMSRAFRES
jgi:HlyD family secretion protein